MSVTVVAIAVVVTVVAISVVLVVTVVVGSVNTVLGIVVNNMAVMRLFVHSSINVVVHDLVVVNDVVVTDSLVVNGNVLDGDLLASINVLCPWLRLSLVPLGVLELHGLHGVVFTLDRYVSIVLVSLGLDGGVCVSNGLHASVSVLHGLVSDVFVVHGLNISVLVMNWLLLGVDVVASLLVVRVLILGVVDDGIVVDNFIFSVDNIVVNNIIIDVAIMSRLNENVMVMVVMNDLVVNVDVSIVVAVVVVIMDNVVILMEVVVAVAVTVVDRLINNEVISVVDRLVNNSLMSVVVSGLIESVISVRAVVVAISVITVVSVVNISVNAISLGILLRSSSSSRGILLGRLVVSLSSSSLVEMTCTVVTVSVVGISVMVIMSGEVVVRNSVLHLAAEEDLGKSKTNGVAELVEVLVVPLGLSISELVVDILAVDDKIVLDVEDEVPRVGESLGHLAEFVEISANGGFALFELVSDIVNDVTEILNSMKNRVESGVLELINDTTEALPNMLGITEALNTVRNFSLNSTSEKTLKDLAHAEEGEVNVGALHSLEVVHLLILLVINLIEKLLPVVVEIKEEFLMVDHLGLTIEKHGSSLTEVLTSINPLTHAVVMETFTSVLENVDTVDNERLIGLEEDLLRVEERLSHPLDLLVIVVINLATVVEHVTDIGNSETELINSLGGLLVGTVPESTHSVFEMMLNRVGIRHAVSDVGHAVEVEGTDEETLDDARNLGVIMRISSLGGKGNYCSSESTIHFDLSVCENV